MKYSTIKDIFKDLADPEAHYDWLGKKPYDFKDTKQVVKIAIKDLLYLKSVIFEINECIRETISGIREEKNPEWIKSDIALIRECLSIKKDIYKHINSHFKKTSPRRKLYLSFWDKYVILEKIN